MASWLESSPEATPHLPYMPALTHSLSSMMPLSWLWHQ